MNHKIKIDKGAFQRLIAVIEPFVGDIIDIAEEMRDRKAERTEFTTIYSGDVGSGRAFGQKNRQMNTACKVDGQAFKKLCEMMWGVAAYGQTDRVLTISADTDTEGNPVMILSLSSRPAEEQVHQQNLPPQKSN